MFSEDIARSMEPVMKSAGHNMKVYDKECIYFFKRYSDKLGFYIRCIDERGRSRGISVELFFRPIDVPDDRMLTFEVGLHIHIATIYRDISDELMASIGKKVILIENNIGNVSTAVLQELEEPYILTKRIPIYKRGILVYDTVKNDESIQQEFNYLKENVCKMLKAKKNRKAFQLGHDFIQSLPSDYFKNKGIELKFGSADLESEFAMQVYAQCILDI